MAVKMKGWEVRLLFVVTLGLLGTFAFDELSPLYGLVGLGIGVLAVGAELLFVKLPADQILCVVAGGFVGVLSGLLVMAALRIGGLRLNEEGVDPLVLVPLALAYVFAHVAVTKARRMGIATGKPETVERPDAPALLDITAVVDGRVADMTVAGLLAGPFVLPESVRERLREMEGARDPVERGRARRGEETLKRLEEAVGKSGGLETRDFGKPGKEKGRMLEYLRKEGSKLISADPDLLESAVRESIRFIDLREVGPATRPVVLPGETLSLKLVRRGRNKGQAVGFIDDGTMVVVEEADQHIGKTVDVLTHTTFRASGGTMAFGKLIEEGDDAGAPGS